MTTLLMLILAAAIIFVQLYGLSYDSDKKVLFSADESNTLKGLFCILVLLVHIPAEYRNTIQDAIGSFAYIGVTFFFMASSYGLKYGIQHKQNYMNRFWIKRLPKIIVPALIINIIDVLFKKFAADAPVSVSAIININDWVKVLLLFYLIFWGVYSVFKVFKLNTKAVCPDIIICILVIVCSLVDKCTPVKLTLAWPAESYGFVYGIVLANIYAFYSQYSNKNWLRKILMLLIGAAVLGLAYLRFKSIGFWGDYCLKIALGVVLLMLVMQLIRRFAFVNRMNKFLGSISYEVYLLQWTAFNITGHIFNIRNSGIFIWASIIVTIALAIVVHYLSRWIVRSFYSIIQNHCDNLQK